MCCSDVSSSSGSLDSIDSTGEGSHGRIHWNYFGLCPATYSTLEKGSKGRVGLNQISGSGGRACRCGQERLLALCPAAYPSGVVHA